MLDDVIDMVRSLIVWMAKQIGLGRSIDSVRHSIWRDYPMLSMPQREAVLSRAIEYNASLMRLSSQPDSHTVGQAFKQPITLQGLQIGGPAETSGVLVIVPWRLAGDDQIHNLTIQARWDDTLRDIRRQANEAIKQFLPGFGLAKHSDIQLLM